MSNRTLTVDVDGVGTFVFRRRTMRDLAAVPNRALVILGGVPQHAYLLEQATMLAVLELLTIQAPDGWSLDDLDPLDDGDVATVRAVYGRLAEEEARFRSGTQPDSAGSGSAAVADDGVPVPPPVQPAAD